MVTWEFGGLVDWELGNLADWEIGRLVGGEMGRAMGKMPRLRASCRAYEGGKMGAR